MLVAAELFNVDMGLLRKLSNAVYPSLIHRIHLSIKLIVELLAVINANHGRHTPGFSLCNLLWGKHL